MQNSSLLGHMHNPGRKTLTFFLFLTDTESACKVYPRARCRFYRQKDGGNSVEITNPVYNHTETGRPRKPHAFFKSVYLDDKTATRAMEM
ncbi:hypothetical protein RRG08_047602 [Elysia crispata]|uniref:Uncharacterized protein n=1 Tax=Elysia crispata TaxID=231223 RepID=A0AAE1DMX6_9GAST|nr:hypothetical protein RRG08_047602 [Elysia crispata]